MKGSLVQRRKASRAIALIAILSLHGAVLALGLSVKGPRPDSTPEAQPIIVSLVLENRPRVAPTLPEAALQVLTPQLLAPTQITLPPDPPDTAPSLVAIPPAPVAGNSPVDEPDAGGSGPVLVSDADYLQLPRVVYPPAARRARAQGLVQVRALVDEEGRPAEVSVAQSSGFDLLDGAACSAVRAARFKPYRRNNVARSMLVIVPIEFSIRSRS